MPLSFVTALSSALLVASAAALLYAFTDSDAVLRASHRHDTLPCAPPPSSSSSSSSSSSRNAVCDFLFDWLHWMLMMNALPLVACTATAALVPFAAPARAALMAVDALVLTTTLLVNGPPPCAALATLGVPSDVCTAIDATLERTLPFYRLAQRRANLSPIDVPVAATMLGVVALLVVLVVASVRAGGRQRGAVDDAALVRVRPSFVLTLLFVADAALALYSTATTLACVHGVAPLRASFSRTFACTDVAASWSSPCALATTTIDDVQLSLTLAHAALLLAAAASSDDTLRSLATFKAWARHLVFAVTTGMLVPSSSTLATALAALPPQVHTHAPALVDAVRSAHAWLVTRPVHGWASRMLYGAASASTAAAAAASSGNDDAVAEPTTPAAVRRVTPLVLAAVAAFTVFILYGEPIVDEQRRNDDDAGEQTNTTESKKRK